MFQRRMLPAAPAHAVGPEVNVWLIGLGIASILPGVAATATWIPARRAARVGPATTHSID
jgi:hypothetical protein